VNHWWCLVWKWYIWNNLIFLTLCYGCKLLKHLLWFNDVNCSWWTQNLAYLFMMVYFLRISFHNYVLLHVMKKIQCPKMLCVATLALGLRPRQRLTKVQAKNEAQESHFMLPWGWECRRVWGNEHSHSQVSSHFGSWSPGGVLNFQKTISRGPKPIGLESPLYHWKSLGT
jgi:hypothetical protein